MESRGKGIRLQHFTPVPRGSSLADISAVVLRQVDSAWRERVQRDGRRCWDLWQEERRRLLALPEWPFEARRVVLVSVSSKATVEIERARYSVPSGWALLDVTAYVGVEDVRLVCRGEVEVCWQSAKWDTCLTEHFRHDQVALTSSPGLWL